MIPVPGRHQLVPAFPARGSTDHTKARALARARAAKTPEAGR